MDDMLCEICPWCYHVAPVLSNASTDTIATTLTRAFGDYIPDHDAARRLTTQLLVDRTDFWGFAELRNHPCLTHPEICCLDIHFNRFRQARSSQSRQISRVAQKQRQARKSKWQEARQAEEDERKKQREEADAKRKEKEAWDSMTPTERSAKERADRYNALTPEEKFRDDIFAWKMVHDYNDFFREMTYQYESRSRLVTKKRYVPYSFNFYNHIIDRELERRRLVAEQEELDRQARDKRSTREVEAGSAAAATATATAATSRPAHKKRPADSTEASRAPPRKQRKVAFAPSPQEVIYI